MRSNTGLASALVVFSLASTTAARTANAQPEDVVDAREEARDHFELGNILMENENFDAALVEFGRSIDLYPTRSALFNAANCQKALHRYVAAMRTFQRWQVQFGDVAPQEDRDRVAASLAELALLVGEVEISVNVEGAEISVDGEVVGYSPLAGPVPLEVGRHEATARRDGYLSAQRQFTLASGERASASLELTEAESEIPVVTVIPPGGNETVPPIDEEDGVPQYWFWTTAGVAGAAAIGGAITGGLTLATSDDYDAALAACRDEGDPQACADGPGLRSAGEDYRLATNVLFGVAGAAAATALVLFFFTDFGADEAPPASVGIAPGPDGVAVTAVVSF